MIYPVRTVPGGSSMDQDSTALEWNQENRRISVAAKDSEAQWQDVS